MMWWLSFADPSRPEGSQLLGCAIVDAMDGPEAIRAAWVLGINPGGEVDFMELEAEKISMLSFDLGAFKNRLLSPVESRDLADAAARDLAG